jgi:alpha-tubulin suppressor-like RCC1 family protein
MALKSDGTVVVWGGDPALAPPAGLSDVIAISAGFYHNLALKRDGTVAAWGMEGMWAPPPANLRNVFAISATTYSSLALTTMEQPAIGKQPLGGKFSSGQSVFLEVVAQGFGPLTYQWWKDGAPIVGETNSALTYLNSSMSESGDYKVVVSNSGGSVTSDTAVVEVVDSAFFHMEGGRAVNFSGFLEPPLGLSDVIAVDSSSTHSLALRADGTVVGWKNVSGTGYLSRGAEIPPADLKNVIDVACGHAFSVALKTNGSIVTWGAVPGAPAPTPDVLSDFVDVAATMNSAFGLRANGEVVCFGEVLFTPSQTDIKSIVAFQLPPGRPQPGLPPPMASPGLAGLRQDGTVWRWSTDQNFGVKDPLSNVTAFDAAHGNYVAVLSSGAVASTNAPPGLTGVKAVSAGPVDDSRGEVAYSAALKLDGTVLTWRGGPDTSGLTNVTLFSVRNNYTLVQTLWPVIVRHPQNLVLDVGYDAVFSTDLRGVGPFRFQWRKNGIDITGETNITLRIRTAQPADAGSYSVVAFNKNGQIHSKEASLTIQPIGILTEPTDEISFVGGKVGFHVGVTGSRPFSFQWRKGATPIPDATNSYYVIDSLKASDAGTFSVDITNPGSSTNSRAATLGVFPAPTWKSVPPGKVVSFDGPVPPADLTNAIAVASGDEYGLALRADGTVTQWGAGAAMKYPPPAGLTNVAKIAAYGEAYGAVRRDGTCVVWGNFPSLTNLYGVVELCMENQVAAIKVDGTWGHTGVDVPGDTSPALFVQLQSISGVLLPDGRVMTWHALDGITSFLGDLTNAVQIAADNYSFLALSSDGSVQGRFIQNREMPDLDLTGLAAIALGRVDYGLGLKRDGSVIGWGNANIPEGLGRVSAINTGGFGVAILAGDATPRLEIRAVGTGQGVVHADIVPPNFILEASDRADGGYGPAPVGIRLEDLFQLNKPQQYFRMRKP